MQRLCSGRSIAPAGTVRVRLAVSWVDWDVAWRAARKIAQAESSCRGADASVHRAAQRLCGRRRWLCQRTHSVCGLLSWEVVVPRVEQYARWDLMARRRRKGSSSCATSVRLTKVALATRSLGVRLAVLGSIVALLVECHVRVVLMARQQRKCSSSCATSVRPTEGPWQQA